MGKTKGEPVDLSDRIYEFVYEDTESKADKLTLKIENFNLEHFDSPVLAKGGILEVEWGYPGHMSPRRKCVVQSVKGFQVLTVEALDKGILANKDTKSRTFEKTTRSAVIALVAKEEGYKPEQIHIEDTGVIYDHVVQARMTNAEFMKLLAKKEGFEFFVDFDGLHWHRKKLGQAPIRTFTWYIDQGQGDLWDIDIDNDITAKPASVTAKGRDPLKKENFEVTANDKTTQREGTGGVLEVIDPRKQDTHDTVTTAKGTASTSPTTEPNASAAKREVDGQFRQSAITLVKLKAKCVGDAGLLAKSIHRIDGIRSLSGNYYFSTVKHTINTSGYVCEFEAKRDGRSATPGAKNAKSSAAQNNQEGKKDTGALDPVEKIDGRTSTTTWTNNGGRS